MRTKIFLRHKVDRFSILKQYFLRGHNAWFALAFSLVNFTLIFYNLLFEKLYFIPEFLKSYLVFFIIFGIFYFPFATYFGFLDYKKGTFSAEQNLQKKINPVWKDVFTKLNKIDEDNQRILDMLSNKEK